MTQPIQQLTEEHGRIRAMLSLFETQLDRFERAERPDYEILGSSIAYCREYLDCWHHPREGMLLEFLYRRAPWQARAGADLSNQHLRLARTTDELVRLFEAVERDAEYPRAHLVYLSRVLVDEYRRHLEWEESSFFPTLESHLFSEDWRDIALLFAEAADPLTENPIDQRYRRLVSAINRT